MIYLIFLFLCNTYIEIPDDIDPTVAAQAIANEHGQPVTINGTLYQPRVATNIMNKMARAQQPAQVVEPEQETVVLSNSIGHVWRLFFVTIALFWSTIASVKILGPIKIFHMLFMPFVLKTLKKFFKSW